MNTINLDMLKNRIDTAHIHDTYDNNLSNKHYLMLVITELSKVVEADKGNSRNKRANVDWFNKRIETSRCYKGLDPEVLKERAFEVIYNETIKGSVEEGLASSVIILLELSKLRNISLELAEKEWDACTKEMEESCKDETFTESIYDISTFPERCSSLRDFSKTINGMILLIFGLAKHLKTDLFWHIEQKMKYNQSVKYTKM